MLDDLIHDAAISLDAVLPNRKAAIALAADLLTPISGGTYDEALRVLSAREALGATAIGHGVALPHARSRESERPAAAIIRLANPIAWGAGDGTDVDIVAAMLWPDRQDDSFPKVIAGICGLLRRPDVLGPLRRAGSADAMRAILELRLPLKRAA